jgi:hypothetical protein
MAEWIEVQDGRNLTRIAMIRGYAITVTGSNDFWSWFIDLKGRYVTEGTARDLTTAAAAAEDEAYWLAVSRKGGTDPPRYRSR